MTPEQQFWWHWWVSLGAAVATFLAVLVAIFGERIRAALFAPRLRLSPVDSAGEKTPARLTWEDEQGRHERIEQARYYHVRVTNSVRWPVATEVQVFLTRLEMPGPDGRLQVRWSGGVPMRWKYQEIYPLARRIGPAADCDVVSVVSGKWVELHPLTVPSNLEAKFRNPVRMVITAEARAAEGTSPPLRIEIAWDGGWADGAVEMRRHMVLSELSGAG